MNLSELKTTILDQHARFVGLGSVFPHIDCSGWDVLHDQWRDRPLREIEAIKASYPHAFCVNEFHVWDRVYDDLRAEVVTWLKENSPRRHRIQTIGDEWGVVGFRDERDAMLFKLRWS